MITNKDNFNRIQLSDGLHKILIGKKEAAITIQGTEEAALATKDFSVLLSEAFWVPELPVNPISLRALMIKGAMLNVNSK